MPVCSTEPIPASSEGALDSERQVQVPAAHDLRSKALAVGSRDLLPHLVAARPDRRSHSGSEPSASECGGSALDDSGQQALPADMQERQPGVALRPAERHRGAVCGHEQHRLARTVAPEAVALFEAGRRQDALRRGLRHLRAVNLIAHRRGRRVSPVSAQSRPRFSETRA